MSRKFAILAALLVSSQAFAETPGQTKLSRVLEMKAEAELRKQSKAIEDELSRGAPESFPNVVSIQGNGATLSARLLMLNGGHRLYQEGDEVGEGWKVSTIRPDAVVIAATDAKTGKLRRVQLDFVRRPSTDGSGMNGGVGGPASQMVAPPRLPTALAQPIGKIK